MSEKKILITADSLRLDYLSEMPETTTFFDKSYENAFATFPSTIGSFPSIIGGTYPTKIGMTKSDSVASKIHTKQKLGITTNRLTSSNYDYDKGFTQFEEMINRHSLTGRVGNMVSNGPLYKPLNTGLQLLREALTRLNIPEWYTPSREFQRASNVIQKMIDTIDPTRNFFVWLHLMDTHHPYHSEKYSDLTRGQSYSITKRVVGRNGGTTQEEHKTKQLYKQGVKQLDDDLKTLYNWAPPQTEIILCGDHGEHLGEKNHWGHNTYLDQPLLNIPLLTKNVQPVNSQVISLIDIPSILLNAQYNNGKLSRKYAYSMCEDQQSVTDGTQILTTSDNKTDNPELQQKLDDFNPDRTVQQGQANTEDLEALGYL